MKKNKLLSLLILVTIIGVVNGQTWNINGNVISNGDYIGTNNSRPFLIYTSATERARISENGRIGINTTIPRAQLESVSSNAIGLAGEMNAGQISEEDYLGTQRIVGTGGNFSDRIGVYGRGINNDFFQDNVPVGVYGYSSGNSESREMGVVGFAVGFGHISIGVKGLTSTNPENSGNTRIGVLGQVFNNNSSVENTQVGLRGDAFSNNGSLNVAVLGATGSGPNDWAGQFFGNVWSTGVFIPSDSRLKREVNDLSRASQLLMNLNPKEYEYKTDEFAKMNLRKGNQYGFLAEELQEIFPELVASTKLALVDGETDEMEISETFLSVDYTGLIPVLVAAFQEQQNEINTLKKVLSENKNGTHLSEIDFVQQNQGFENLENSGSLNIEIYPNPVDQQLSIDFNSTKQVDRVILHSYSGAILLSENVVGEKHVLNTYDISNGVFILSFFKNDKLIKSETIIIQH